MPTITKDELLEIVKALEASSILAHTLTKHLNRRMEVLAEEGMPLSSAEMNALSSRQGSIFADSHQFYALAKALDEKYFGGEVLEYGEELTADT